MSSGMWFYTLGQARLKGLLEDPQGIEPLLRVDRASGGPKASFGFNDEWHAMLFLLTDDRVTAAVPAGDRRYDTAFCFAGQPLDGAPFDGCCLMTAGKARHAAMALQALKAEGFKRRFESASFQRADDESIYRGGYWKDPSHFDELARAYSGLQAFFSGAAKRDEGVIHYWV